MNSENSIGAIEEEVTKKRRLSGGDASNGNSEPAVKVPKPDFNSDLDASPLDSDTVSNSIKCASDSVVVAADMDLEVAVGVTEQQCEPETEQTDRKSNSNELQSEPEVKSTVVDSEPVDEKAEHSLQPDVEPTEIVCEPSIDVTKRDVVSAVEMDKLKSDLVVEETGADTKLPSKSVVQLTNGDVISDFQDGIQRSLTNGISDVERDSMALTSDLKDDPDHVVSSEDGLPFPVVSVSRRTRAKAVDSDGMTSIQRRVRQIRDSLVFEETLLTLMQKLRTSQLISPKPQVVTEKKSLTVYPQKVINQAPVVAKSCTSTNELVSVSDKKPVPMTGKPVITVRTLWHQNENTRKLACTLALQKQIEKSIQHVARSRKVNPGDSQFMASHVAGEFVYLLGLEEAVGSVMKESIPKRALEERTVAYPFECVKCVTDFTPSWKIIDSAKVTCERCNTKALIERARKEYEAKVKQAVVDGLKQAGEIEQQLRRAILGYNGISGMSRVDTPQQRRPPPSNRPPNVRQSMPQPVRSSVVNSPSSVANPMLSAFQQQAFLNYLPANQLAQLTENQRKHLLSLIPKHLAAAAASNTQHTVQWKA